MSAPARTLVDVLRRHAAERSGAIAYRFLSESGEEEGSLTYGELCAEAAALATLLRARAGHAERALLLLPPGRHAVVGFWGCLFSGVAAIPAPLPDAAAIRQGRLLGILADARPRLILTTQALIEAARGLFPAEALDGVEVVAVDAPRAAATGALGALEPPAPEAVAFVQYTSGSTSEPKGVVVTHANLMASERQIELAFGHEPSMCAVSWLPLFHDMGLVGTMLQPAFMGGECVLMPPAAFLRRPVLWLQAISRYRGTSAGAPSFAFELCVERVSNEERAGLDLSSWRVAFNGAEPVRSETLERFAAAFAPCGFDAAAFLPCYGLAEATLLVSGSRTPRVRRLTPEAGRQPSRPVVSCGRPAADTEIAIVDAGGARLGDGEVGEIWVRGPQVAAGYLGKAEATRDTFGARLEGQAYLRTGDLGLLDGGELFVTGRQKDLIIVRGQNHHPHDLEETARKSHLGFGPSGAAFALDGEEAIAVVQTVRRGLEVFVPRDHPLVSAGPGAPQGGAAEPAPGALHGLHAAQALRRAILEEHGLDVARVVFVSAGGVPRTTSGKVQRRRTRELLLLNELPVLCEWRRPHGPGWTTCEAPPAARRALQAPPAASEIEAFVCGWVAWRARLPLEVVSVAEPLAHFGLDSYAIVELTAALEGWLDRVMAPTVLISHPTVASLAAHLAEAYPRLPRAQAEGGGRLGADDVKRLLAADLSDTDFEAELRRAKR